MSTLKKQYQDIGTMRLSLSKKRLPLPLRESFLF